MNANSNYLVNIVNVTLRKGGCTNCELLGVYTMQPFNLENVLIEEQDAAQLGQIVAAAITPTATVNRYVLRMNNITVKNSGFSLGSIEYLSLSATSNVSITNVYFTGNTLKTQSVLIVKANSPNTPITILLKNITITHNTVSKSSDAPLYVHLVSVVNAEIEQLTVSHNQLGRGTALSMASNTGAITLNKGLFIGNTGSHDLALKASQTGSMSFTNFVFQSNLAYLTNTLGKLSNLEINFTDCQFNHNRALHQVSLFELLQASVSFQNCFFNIGQADPSYRLMRAHKSSLSLLASRFTNLHFKWGAFIITDSQMTILNSVFENVTSSNPGFKGILFSVGTGSNVTIELCAVSGSGLSNHLVLFQVFQASMGMAKSNLSLAVTEAGGAI